MTRKHQCRIQLAASEPVAYRLVNQSINQSINPSLFQAWAHRNSNTENNKKSKSKK